MRERDFVERFNDAFERTTMRWIPTFVTVGLAFAVYMLAQLLVGCGSAAMLGRATAGLERGAVLLDVVVEQAAGEYSAQVEKRTAECEAAKPDSQSAFERCMAPFDAEARRKVELALERLVQSQEVLAEVAAAARDLSDAMPEAPSP